MSKKRAGSSPGFGVSKKPQAPKFRLMLKLRQLAKKSPQLAKEFVYSWNVVKCLIALELIINLFVIRFVKYTEIDWSTYMHQIGQIFNTSTSLYKDLNFDYGQIEGPTGPLVYPAGHVYVFYIFKLLTENGTNIQSAQYLYMLIYMAQLYLTYKIYSHGRVLQVSIQ